MPDFQCQSDVNTFQALARGMSIAKSSSDAGKSDSVIDFLLIKPFFLGIFEPFHSYQNL